MQPLTISTEIIQALKMTHSPRVLVIGATGYLGLHIIRQLQKNNFYFKALARNRNKLLDIGVSESQIIECQVTDPKALESICEGIDIVISCLGITRQRDNLKYMDVDYQANLNVLIQAEHSAVSKFIYISAFNAEKYNKVRMLYAKEKFARRLLRSVKLTPCVIRPNGFFSDLEEIYHMATKGKVYLFGTKPINLNPIHGEDLALFCLKAIHNKERELDVGGPETLSTQQLAQLAFHAQYKKVTIITVPDVIRRMALWVMNKLPEKWGGPAEFFLTAMENDSTAPKYGQHKIENYYNDMFVKQNDSSS